MKGTIISCPSKRNDTELVSKPMNVLRHIAFFRFSLECVGFKNSLSIGEKCKVEILVVV